MVEQQVKMRLDELPGQAGLYYKNLGNGQEFYLGGEDRYLAASVIKVPIMVELFRQAEAGLLQLDQEVVLQEPQKVPVPGVPHYGEQYLAGQRFLELFPESGVLNYLHTGLRLTLRDLCTLMIVISDNTATNMLIEVLGQDQINELLATLNFTKTKLNRQLFEVKAGCREETENWISLREMGRLLELMYQGRLVSAQASRQMLALLLNQQFNYKIPFYLPHLPVAHKTGEDEGLTNDIGLVYCEGGPFVLCLAAYDTNVPQADRTFSEIARLIWAQQKKGAGI